MTKALATQETPGPMVVPDFLKDVHGTEGFGNMEKQDVILPRLGICQALTPQKKKSHANYIPNLADGDIFNSVSGEIYGQSVELIPLLFSKARLYFAPERDGRVLCQSPNGIDGGKLSKTCAACPNSQWDPSGKKPACDIFYNYPVIIPAQRHVLVSSFHSMSLKAGKQWNSRMKLMGDRPMFAGVYELRTVEAHAQKGDFFAPAVSFKRFPTQEEFEYAKATYETMRDRAIKVDETGINEDAGEGAEGDEHIPF